MFEHDSRSGSAIEAALTEACAAWLAPRPALQVFTPEHWAWLGDVELDPTAGWAFQTPAEASAEATPGCHGATAPGDTAVTGAVPDDTAVTGAAASDQFDRRAARLQAEFASDADLLAAARAAEADIARAQAGRARALAAFAARRPVSLDRPDSAVGAAARASRATRPEALRAVSEFCVDEVAVGLSMGTPATTALLVQSVRLVDQLPATLAALEAGAISWAHVGIACELIAPLAAELRAVAEDKLIARASGRTPQSWRPMVRRVVLKLDADAIGARVAEAVRERKVVVYPAADGMATLCATLPAPVARAVEDLLRRHAHAVRVPGDERSQGERMADCLVDLLLDPQGHGLSPVQAQLTVVASVRTLLGNGSDGDEPGEVGGDVVPAAMVRELAAALGLLPDEQSPAARTSRPNQLAPHALTPVGAGDQVTGTPGETDSGASHGKAAETPTSPPPRNGNADRMPEGERATHACDEHLTRRRAALADLLNTRTTTGTGLVARPTIALVDEDTGELVALTDATGLRRAARHGTGLGPPPEVPGYRPSAALEAFIRLRDRRCQFPGCRARPTVCDLDHQQPWLTGGATAHDNLACLCRHHHRLSHQAPGWTLHRTTDRAGLQWTTPTGQRVTTRPPTTGTDDDLLDSRSHGGTTAPGTHCALLADGAPPF